VSNLTRFQAFTYVKTLSLKAFEELKGVDSVRPDLFVVERGAFEVKLR
jgi:hypothetical protein